ncbi:methylamine utilization protein [Marinomonas sp. 5E14-1]|uniref:methylamine utilization protein n=1 Tax=Marinomonas sp. 5E14-1 TaxID=3153922 RepID=UPI00326339C4
MRYLIALVCSLSLSNIWADMTLTIHDQNDQPVSNAVVSLSGSFVSTPDAVEKMNQIHSSFVPRVLIVQKDQYVSFPNSDDIRHHVYSFSIPKAFEIKLYKGSEIPPIQFDAPGMVVLGCNIHDSMIGYIYVANNEYTAKTDKKGQVTLPAKLGDKVSFWSERLIEGVTSEEMIDITSDTAQTVKIELLPPIEVIDHESHSY